MIDLKKLKLAIATLLPGTQILVFLRVLFLVLSFSFFFINDLPNISNNSGCTLFADDSVFSLNVENAIDVGVRCNGILKSVLDRKNCNRLTINTDKTFYMLHSNRPVSNSLSINLNEQPINSKDNSKYLGLILDNSLNFKPHITFICNKISKAIGIIYRSRDFLPKYILISLYYTLVYPYLNYCILAWGNTFTSHLEPIRILQKKLVRIITFQPYSCHTSPLFQDLNFLKLDDIYKYRAAVYIFHERGRGSYRRTHSYGTRGRDMLIPDYQRLTLTQHSVTHSGPSIWNSLPSYLTEIDNINSFKRQLKIYLISGYIS